MICDVLNKWESRIVDLSKTLWTETTTELQEPCAGNDIKASQQGRKFKGSHKKTKHEQSIMKENKL
jgi:hypothetical protein